MKVYYNEIDLYCAQWLRNLMAEGLIPTGDIDTRSIEDVTPNELSEYDQCHFFAGLGGWPLALQLAEWPSDRPVWTGSCPCQPFSAAGKGLGFADERHLWPSWQHLIAQCGPPTIFGEQVASKDAEPWIDLVHADMEGMAYAFGCVAFPSASIGSPQIRDRNYWVAYADDTGFEGWALPTERSAQRVTRSRRVAGWLADANGRNASTERQQSCGEQRQQSQDSDVMRLADANGIACGQGSEVDRGRHSRSNAQIRSGSGSAVMSSRPGPINGFWGSADWLGCTDEKWRPVEPGSFPLAHGISNRVGRLRAYGNAINPRQAAAFIQSYIEARSLV